MAVVTLKDTLKPWKDMVTDIFLTFRPYAPKDGLQPTPRYLELIKKYRSHEDFWKKYLDTSIWGDVAQFPRGLVNVGKGLLRILRGAIKLVPPLFLIWCVYQMHYEPAYSKPVGSLDYAFSYSPSFWLAFKGELKGLGYDFVNGIGILLRGVLQMATAPLTLLFRIPIRYFKAPEYVADEFESEDEESPDEENQEPAPATTERQTTTHNNSSVVLQPTGKPTSYTLPSSLGDSDEENEEKPTGYSYTRYSSSSSSSDD